MVSLSMDVFIIAMMSFPNSFVYMYAASDSLLMPTLADVVTWTGKFTLLPVSSVGSYMPRDRAKR